MATKINVVINGLFLFVKEASHFVFKEIFNYIVS